ncbi:hypothetical protein RCL1_007986 [Eukaryota sp. TZLM3-RCL]
MPSDDDSNQPLNIPSPNLHTSCCAHVSSFPSNQTKLSKSFSKTSFSKIRDYYFNLTFSSTSSCPPEVKCHVKCKASSSFLWLCLECALSGNLALFCHSSPLHRTPSVYDYVADHAILHTSSHKHSIFLRLSSNHILCTLCNSLTLMSSSHHLYSILSPFLVSTQNPIIDNVSTKLSGLGINSRVYFSPPLINLGNSCFFNSAIQCLLSLNVFSKYFCLLPQFEPFLTGKSENNSVLINYSNLCNLLYQTSVNSKLEYDSNCRNIIKSLWKSTRVALPAFSDYSQHDSCEFLTSFLSILSDSLSDDGESIYSGHVSNCFRGEQISQVHCSGCNKQFKTRETFLDLSLPIPNGQENSEENKTGFFSFLSKRSGPPLTLFDCLSEYFKSENLRNENCFDCELCRTKKPATKKFFLSKLPEVLIIQLKRFKQNNRGMTKIKNLVEFPQSNLNISQYLIGSEHSEPCLYDLYAIINHHGNVHGGHYTSIVRINQSNRTTFGGNDCVSPTFEVCDDSRIFPFNISSATGSNGLLSIKDAYVLFYVKQSNNLDNSRENLINEILKDARLLKFNHELTVFENSNHSIVVPYPTTRNVVFHQPNVISSLDFSRIIIPGFWLYSFIYFSQISKLNTSFYNCQHDSLKCARMMSVYHSFSISRTNFDLIMKEKSNLIGPVVSVADVNSPCSSSLPVCSICELNHRRIYEKQRIYSIESKFQGKNLFWFFISTSWLNKWKLFIRSVDQNPPTGIMNSDLVTSSDCIKPNLQQGVHYRALSGPVFRELHDIYGGGPIIVRQEPDIYSILDVEKELVYSEYGKVFEFI